MTTSTVHVAVFDTLADWETGYATAHIRRRDWQREPGRYEVATVGLSREPVTTMGGVRILPDLALDELRPQDSAMLILAGGDTWGEDSMAGFRAAARRFLEAGVPVAAICGATFGLALEGLLDDRAHTSNAAEYLAFTGYQGGDQYVDEPAVTDGDLITASGVAPAHFARAIFDRLGIYTPEVAASWFKLYGDRDPAGFFELMAVPEASSAQSPA
ncbi:MAG TPA: type 1 glutamine amidotransferase family protein [Streptosporangiaceae bacterium]|nr:type 1 glutamine amidotransferase family protein [Streptosporangiaceae bacterium]